MSTNRDPEILKKSNAIPYTIIDNMRKITPEPGFPIPNNAKRKTHAIILKIITCLIPNRFKKNGIVKINSVSEICDNEIIKTECSTPKVP
ncbi:hypothetical protein D3C85_1724350 [compost metagenome]